MANSQSNTKFTFKRNCAAHYGDAEAYDLFGSGTGDPIVSAIED
jgi:hypothetical protein